MNAADRHEFVDELIRNVRAEIIGKVSQMPDFWDGVELRRYIADKFAACVIKGMMRRKRTLAYRNVIRTTNL